MRHSLTRLAGVAVTLALGAVAAAPSVARAAEAVGLERIVAVVGGEIILLSELQERAQQVQQALDDRGSPDARREIDKQMRTLLERMIDDLLVLQQASDLKLTVEAAEIERAMDEVKKANSLTDEQFEAALAEQGFSPTAYKRDLRKQIMRMKVINTAVRSRINISDEDLKHSYDQGARTAGVKREARVRHVLITVKEGAPKSEVEARRRLAERIANEARGAEGGKGARDFAALAREHSDDESTKAEGGELGWVSEGEGLPEAFEQAVFTATKDGEIVGPVPTDRGFEIVQIEERKDGEVRPFAEVKEPLRAQLYQGQLEKQTQLWLGEIRRKTHVDVRY